MKRILTTIALLCCLLTSSVAQQGLNVEQVFQRYGHLKGCKMVEMHDAQLRGYLLHTYKALTYRRQGSQIEQLLKVDRQQAHKIREVVADGRVTSGYYQMAPVTNSLNRYILFSRQGSEAGVVIYIEGQLSPDDILKLCYSK